MPAFNRVRGNPPHQCSAGMCRHLSGKPHHSSFAHFFIASSARPASARGLFGLYSQKLSCFHACAVLLGILGISRCLQGAAARSRRSAYNLPLCGRRSMAGPELPKLKTWVRFPSPAPVFVSISLSCFGLASPWGLHSGLQGQAPAKPAYFPQHGRCAPPTGRHRCCHHGFLNCV